MRLWTSGPLPSNMPPFVGPSPAEWFSESVSIMGES